jgi:N-acetylglucosaminyldiphosphoundecaprenol N-acetyl-beta-D-mannosaminyltransferase
MARSGPGLHRGQLPPNVPAVNFPLRFNVLGTGVSALCLNEARNVALGAREKKHLGYICCATAYNLNLARSDASLRSAYNRSLLTTPDGMPLVWLGRWHGHKGITRVYGPDLMELVCDIGRASGLTHYFYGGKAGVAEELKNRLTTRYPGLQVVGTFTPPFRPLTADEGARLHADVANGKPDIIWVGLSTPIQEKFMADYADSLDAGLMIGVGAAFDFLSGRVTQAPRWMQRSGLEWFYRFCTEPSRLWKRYLVHNPCFVLRAGMQALGLKRYPLDGDQTRRE